MTDTETAMQSPEAVRELDPNLVESIGSTAVERMVNRVQDEQNETTTPPIGQVMKEMRRLEKRLPLDSK